MTEHVTRSQGRSLVTPLLLALAGMLALNEPAAASTLKVIHSFCNADGQCPEGYVPGKLIADSSGDLFGTLADAGQYNFGAVFELIPNAKRTRWRFKTIYSFCAEAGCPDGAHPNGLIMDNSGNLYGGTSEGGAGQSGVIYKLSPKGKYRILYTLCANGGPCNDGFSPFGLTYAGAAQGVPYDGASPLYGVNAGGENHYGNAFILERKRHNAWSYSVIYSFCSIRYCHDGQLPTALALDESGDIYGVAPSGGQYRHGVMFKLTSTGKHQWEESPVYEFCPAKDCTGGGWPYAISMGSDGTFFGVTLGYGPTCELHHDNRCGTLFQINPDGAQYNVLYGFCAQQECIDGREPIEMQEIQPNDFFGVTSLGGSSDSGTIFQFQDGAFKSLYQFCSLKNCQDGKWPQTGLTADGAGSFFGTTLEGGAFGYGGVFQFTP